MLACIFRRAIFGEFLDVYFEREENSVKVTP